MMIYWDWIGGEKRSHYGPDHLLSLLSIYACIIMNMAEKIKCLYIHILDETDQSQKHFRQWFSPFWLCLLLIDNWGYVDDQAHQSHPKCAYLDSKLEQCVVGNHSFSKKTCMRIEDAIRLSFFETANSETWRLAALLVCVRVKWSTKKVREEIKSSGKKKKLFFFLVSDNFGRRRNEKTCNNK